MLAFDAWIRNGHSISDHEMIQLSKTILVTIALEILLSLCQFS